MRLKDDYVAARCCRPASGDSIVGYYSHDNIIKVHKSDCPNLGKAEKERLIPLIWADIIAPEEAVPEADYELLDDADFRILQHHFRLGCDYSIAVAVALRLDESVVFERHRRLRTMGLLERVEPRIIRYRKNIVPGKWIKHRNHTYYELTDKGKLYLRYYEAL